jgi:hypothetical protein
LRLLVAALAQYRRFSALALVAYFVSLGLGTLGHRCTQYSGAGHCASGESRLTLAQADHSSAHHGCVICMWLRSADSTGPTSPPRVTSSVAVTAAFPTAPTTAAQRAPFLLPSRGPPLPDPTAGPRTPAPGPRSPAVSAAQLAST